jgi:glycopeptide antibiotics resistance protein
LKHKLTFLLWSIYIILIFTLALLPDNPKAFDLSLEKPWIIRHILAFVVFILLTRITFPKLKWYWLVLIGLGFGLSIELLQLWLTGGVREFSLLDVGYDVVGIAVGMVLLSLRSQVKSLKTK